MEIIMGPHLTDYITLDILVGIGVGMLGGIITSFLVPLRIHKHPATYADVVAFSGAFFLMILPLLFPHTLIFTMVITFLIFWFFMPILFGKRYPSGGESKVDPELIESLSPEGRVSVLEDLGILPVSGVHE
jgi:hypothetical protein